MDRRILLVVGDDYSEFASNDSVLTFSAFDAGSVNEGDIVVEGLGLSAEQGRKLRELSNAGVEVVRTRDLCPIALTRKSFDDNVLVSEPERLGPFRYSSHLNVSATMDRLVDHVTGQHLNGMLLIESARQAAMAAFEKHYGQGRDRDWAISWSRCDSKFLDLAFPIPTAIETKLPELEDVDELPHGPLAAHVVVKQAGAVVCEVLLEATIMREQNLDRIESARARRVAALAGAGESWQPEVLARPA